MASGTNHGTAKLLLETRTLGPEISTSQSTLSQRVINLASHLTLTCGAVTQNTCMYTHMHILLHPDVHMQK